MLDDIRVYTAAVVIAAAAAIHAVTVSNSRRDTIHVYTHTPSSFGERKTSETRHYVEKNM